MGYTVRELGEIIGRKPAMIYNYFNEDRDFFYSHRQMGSNGYIYDDEVLERLKLRIGVSNGVVEGNSKSKDEESPQPTSPVDVRENNEAFEAVKAELQELKNKYEELQARMEQVEAERKQLLEQNGHLLLLLSQEKAEKQLLLPPPRKTIGERIRSLFHRPPTNAE